MLPVESQRAPVLVSFTYPQYPGLVAASRAALPTDEEYTARYAYLAICRAPYDIPVNFFDELKLIFVTVADLSLSDLGAETPRLTFGVTPR